MQYISLVAIFSIIKNKNFVQMKDAYPTKIIQFFFFFSLFINLALET